MSEKKSGNELSSDSPMEGPENSKEEMMDMFASVWVKVEVEEDAGDSEEDTKTSTSKPSQKTPKQKKILKCDSCDYTTPHSNCLKLHILGHSGEKPHSCTICNFTTRSNTSLRRHMMSQHQTETGADLETLKCDQCDYTSIFKWNLNSHKRKHGKEKKFKCIHCNYVTAYKHHFQKHTKTHKNTVFKCDKCPFQTKFEGHISRHLAKIHNEVTETAYRCDYCDFSTITKWRLTAHLQRFKQDKVLKCSYCDFETEYKCESKRHKIEHYSEIYKPKTKENPESKRERDFSHEFEWNDHEDKPKKRRKTSGDQSYAIDEECVDWKNIPVTESEDINKPFQCSFCSYTSRFKASVQRHFQRQHTGSQNRPYKCVNCDFSTKTKDQIALHNKRSKSDTALECVECNFSTTFKCQFAMHQKCHYSFKCNICDHTCRNKYDLQKHFAISHSGELFKCQFCDYKAPRKDSLLCHETIHTGNKPFKCEHCSYTSVRKSLIDLHMKRYHSEVKASVTVVSDAKIQSLRTVDDKANESNLTGFKDILPE